MLTTKCRVHTGSPIFPPDAAAALCAPPFLAQAETVRKGAETGRLHSGSSQFSPQPHLGARLKWTPVFLAGSHARSAVYSSEKKMFTWFGTPKEGKKAHSHCSTACQGWKEKLHYTFITMKPYSAAASISNAKSYSSNRPSNRVHLCNMNGHSAGVPLHPWASLDASSIIIIPSCFEGLGCITVGVQDGVVGSWQLACQRVNLHKKAQRGE